MVLPPTASCGRSGRNENRRKSLLERDNMPQKKDQKTSFGKTSQEQEKSLKLCERKSVLCGGSKGKELSSICGGGSGGQHKKEKPGGVREGRGKVGLSFCITSESTKGGEIRGEHGAWQKNRKLKKGGLERKKDVPAKGKRSADGKTGKWWAKGPGRKRRKKFGLTRKSPQTKKKRVKGEKKRAEKAESPRVLGKKSAKGRELKP